MATSAFDSLRDESAEITETHFEDFPVNEANSLPPELGDDNGFAGEATFEAVMDESVPFRESGALQTPDTHKSEFEIKGFFVSSGPGIYDGGGRLGNEPRDNYFVDLQDYETGDIRRVWGVALRNVIEMASKAYSLQPGSRIQLVQQGTLSEVSNAVDSDTSVMRFEEKVVNAWACHPDRGPLPSHLAHMMAGINVDKALERIALRYDIGLDDPQLPAWKAERKAILRAIGDDPQEVRSWLSNEARLSADEETKLVERAVELAGYGLGNPQRRQQEIETRMNSLALMHAEQRFDYLMSSAKPHLVNSNTATEERLSAEVAKSIEQVAAMAVPAAETDSNERSALLSALKQSVDGLTLQQQLDYLQDRRERLVKDLTAALGNNELESAENRFGRQINRFEAIDSAGLSQEEYQLLLEERLKLAETPQEKGEMLKQEAEARKAAQEIAEAEFERIDALYQRFSRERDVDVLAYLASQMVAKLSTAISEKAMPAVKSIFEALGGVGAWRRAGCEDGLKDMLGSFNAAKESPTYRAFLNDPLVQEACGVEDVSDALAGNRDLARTDVLQRHVAAQDRAASPPLSSGGIAQPSGLWKNAIGAAQRFASKVNQMSPEHLIKNGSIDNDWLGRMQSGIDEFSEQVKKTLMADRVREQFLEILASVLASIRTMLEMARELISKVAPTIAKSNNSEANSQVLDR